MLGYLYKELKTNKLILGVMFGLMMFFNVCPFASATGDDKPEGAFFYAVFFIMSGSSYLVIGMCASGLVQTDERKKWGYYNAAAPNGIRMQVGSIYIIILFALVCCFCISWVINTIMRKMSANVPNVTGMMIAMVLSAMPLFKLGDAGVIIWGCLAALTLLVCVKVEKLKKCYNIQTYKEISAFMEGKPLDEIVTDRKKYTTAQKVMFGVASGAAGMLVSVLINWLLK
jgi:hypothetical protein